MEKHLKISKNFTFSFLFLSFDSSKSVYFEEEIFDESHLNMAEHTIITVSIRIRTLSKKKILRRKKKRVFSVGGNLDWLATWLSSIRELEQRIKRRGRRRRRRGAWYAREIARKGEGGNVVTARSGPA